MIRPGRALCAVTLAALLVLAPWGRARALENITGVWMSSFLFSRIEAHVTQAGNVFTGVVYVHGPKGRETYHILGTVVDDKVVGYHGSGHIFEGTLVNKDHVKGTLTTAVRSLEVRPGGHALRVPGPCGQRHRTVGTHGPRPGLFSPRHRARHGDGRHVHGDLVRALWI